MEVRYQTLFGTKKQTVEIATIIEKFPEIKATILDHRIIFPRTTPDDKRELHYYELELTAPLEDLNKYFKVLKEKQDTLFKELTNSTS